MKVDNAIDIGIQGIHRGLEKMDKTALAIARNGTTNRSANAADVARSLVELNQAQHETEISIKVVRAADEVIDVLLDEWA